MVYFLNQDPQKGHLLRLLNCSDSINASFVHLYNVSAPMQTFSIEIMILIGNSNTGCNCQGKETLECL